MAAARVRSRLLPPRAPGGPAVPLGGADPPSRGGELRAICWLAALAACIGASTPAATVRTDSAGVEIVVGPAQDRVLAWRLERERVLGGAQDGPDSFYRVRQGLVDADDDGDLYVRDPTNARAVAFDPAGRVYLPGGRIGFATCDDVDVERLVIARVVRS